LNPGQSTEVTMNFNILDFTLVDETGQRVAIEGDWRVTIDGISVIYNVSENKDNIITA